MTSPLCAQIQLDSNTNMATAGYFQLTWSGDPQQAPYVLQQSITPSFSKHITLYQGADTASLQSGLSDGTYHYRVLGSQGVVSNSVQVEVKHHALKKAFSFFALGAVMFLILLVVLITASRKGEYE